MTRRMIGRHSRRKKDKRLSKGVGIKRNKQTGGRRKMRRRQRRRTDGIIKRRRERRENDATMEITGIKD